MSNKKIEKIVNKYEMTGAYISNGKRHEYKHYNKVAKWNMTVELESECKAREREAIIKYRIAFEEGVADTVEKFHAYLQQEKDKDE